MKCQLTCDQKNLKSIMLHFDNLKLLKSPVLKLYVICLLDLEQLEL